VKRFKLIVIVCVAIAVFGFLLTGTNKKYISSEHAGDVQPAVNATISPSIPPKPIALLIPDVVAINDSADFLDLAVGQKFSVIGNTQNSQVLIVLDVISKSASSAVTLITASSDSGLTSVVTLTDSLTNILIKTPSNIFEYSGGKFKGVVDPIKDLNLDDDMHFNESQEMIILDDVISEVRLEP
jgi:hypothetical protein